MRKSIMVLLAIMGTSLLTGCLAAAAGGGAAGGYYVNENYKIEKKTDNEKGNAESDSQDSETKSD